MSNSDTDKSKDAIEAEQKKSYDLVKAAYQESEAHLFIHVHLRGYDEKGQGKQMDASFVDRYGAPIQFNESWTDGYRTIEEQLLIHNEICQNNYTYFPLVGGYGGGAHLYKTYNDKDPWDWTGWVPRHNHLPYDAYSSTGSTSDSHLIYTNRFFAALRGNEIQNDMWDYDPGMLSTDEVVKGPYLGGYWFYKNVEARYLHIISLKTHYDGAMRRYNYIVHPLAYRPLLNDLPDCGIDGIQWTVNHILDEENLKKQKKWGGKVHGIELFNDYTYYYSWICHYNQKFYNGSVQEGCIVWYDTYPLEYCEFILDNALSHGVYLQTLSANDAFYNRETSHINDIGSKHDDHMEPAEIILRRNQALLSDPKGKYVTETLLTVDESKERMGFIPGDILAYFRYKKRFDESDVMSEELVNSNRFLKSRPYGFDTVFGYTAMIDTDGCLRDALYPSHMKDADLNRGEDILLKYLIEGQFYSHTGIYDMIDYGKSILQVPYIVAGQNKTNELWFNERMKDFELIFEFPPEKTKTEFPPPWQGKLLWRYTIEYVHKKERVLSTGYFKLNPDKPTKLDLRSAYKDFKIKWIRFTIFYAENPQQRAWFSPIKGSNFQEKSAKLPLRNRIAVTKKEETDEVITYTETGEFKPSSRKVNENFEYTFDKGEEEHLHSYFMQVMPLQQSKTAFPHQEGSKTTEKYRYLENVHGYFAMSKELPTKINMSNSWDSTTVDENVIFFYRVDVDTCELSALEPINPTKPQDE